jgi:AcrR family transcriptional regulator
MSRQPSPRQRMVDSAVVLMQERGVEATSFSDVIEHSGAPRGSIYHHFPRGKAQLIEEATRQAGDFVARGAEHALAGGDPLAGLDAAERWWSQVVLDSDYARGCPIAAATISSDAIPAAREVAAEVFRSWQVPFEESFRRNGLPRKRARSLAALVIAAIEGAVLLCRAEQSVEPLTQVVAELRATIRAALKEAA